MQCSKSDYFFRVVLVGDSAVGKTSIFTAYRKQFYRDQTVPTECFEATIDRNGQMVRLRICDTQGQERYRSLTNSFYRGTNGCVLCFDVTNAESFNSLDRWLSDIREYVGKEIPCVIVGTKGYLGAHKRKVTTGDATSFSERHRIPLIELVSLDKENLDTVFSALADMMINETGHRDAQTCRDNVNLGQIQCETPSKCAC